MGGLLGAYFLGPRLLAISPKIHKWDDHKVHHQNVAHFCPQCGEVWGRIMDERVAGWFAQSNLCAKHGGGSFISPWRNVFEELPPEVLQYELELRLNQYEVNQNATQQSKTIL